MNNNIAEKFIKKAASRIKELSKARVKQVYPNIDCVENKKELITSWYVGALAASCDQAFKVCPIKQASVGMFYNKYAPSPINISYPDKRFNQIIIESKDKQPLLIKIVDNIDNIYLYSATLKLSQYNIIDISKEINNIFNDITYVSIISGKNDPILKNVDLFAHNLSKELKNIFNIQWTYRVYWETGILKIVFYHITQDNHEAWGIEMNIILAFTIYDICQIIKEYRLNGNFKDIMRKYMYICTNIKDITIPLINFEEYSNKFNTYGNVLKHIASETHLLNPLLDGLLSMLFDKHNKLKWFVNAVEMLEKNPNYSFEDFFTTVKYNTSGEELIINYLNIYNK